MSTAAAAMAKNGDSVGTEALFAAIQTDTPGWQHQAFERFFPLVNGLLRKSLGPADGGVEDCLYDVFLRFFEKAQRVESAEGLRGYIVSITLNLIRQELRQRIRARSVFDQQWVSEPQEQQTYPEGLFAGAALLRLTRILEELRADERAVFVLRTMRGMTVEATADALSISESTVKRRFQRARERVTKRVNRDPLLCEYVGKRNGVAKHPSH